ncbi:hypothetical protein QEN19_003269 [Hanseniaspora menglaensis]
MSKNSVNKKQLKPKKDLLVSKAVITEVEKVLSTSNAQESSKSSNASDSSSEAEEQKIKRFRPNIIITGTPGCGKSTLSLKLNKEESLKTTLFNISEFAKDENIFESYDEDRKSHVIDEDELLNRLEGPLRNGGCIIDWHCNDIFPERLIDLVIVLKCGTSALYDRLKARKYHDAKIQENIDAEIMSVVLEDALESYDKRIVIELPSESEEQIEDNLSKIMAWYEQWTKDNGNGVTNEVEEFYKDREMPEDFDSDEE